MSDRESRSADYSTPPAVSLPLPPEPSEVEPTEVLIDLDAESGPVLDLTARTGDTAERAARPAESPPFRATEPVDSLRRRRLFGLEFVDAVGLDPVVEALAARHRPQRVDQVTTVLTPNVDIMVQLDRDRNRSGPVWRMFRSSQFCLPDGQPIVLASRLLGRPLRGRLTGSGLFALLWPRLVADGRTLFVVASSEAVADRLTAEYPSVGTTVPPIFDVSDRSAIEQVAKTILASATVGSPEFVFLGIGNPKDALIADAVLRMWPDEY
ncbi:MAG: WecB/TagA/CpsF family glycosyltransferase, partial [Acidimicrobiia bacterium]|nr:WecB/TagA/CpsF family glycosyltransferase [Acidimicrobiia bacterium]